MKFSIPLTVAALASLAVSTPIQVKKRASPLTIELKEVSGSEVKAILTNTGSEDLKLLKTGTILDDQPTEKVQVHNAKGRVAFNGIRVRAATKNLDENAFTPLAAGQSLELDIEVAELHDLSEGGDFDILSVGALPYALANSTELSGAAVPFMSNKLSIKVDGAKAAKVASTSINARSTVQSDCTGDELEATNLALANCAKLAAAAAEAAQSGDESLFTEYFISSSNKEDVVARLKAIAEECGATTKETTTSCTDSQNVCSNNVLAYTLPARNHIVNCPLFFSGLPDLSEQCSDQDQATTTLHEMTHAPGVFSPSTEDHAYGYAASTQLSAAEALDNADSYALFSNAVFTNCTNGGSSSSGGSSSGGSSSGGFGGFGGFGSGSSGSGSGSGSSSGDDESSSGSGSSGSGSDSSDSSSGSGSGSSSGDSSDSGSSSGGLGGSGSGSDDSSSGGSSSGGFGGFGGSGNGTSGSGNGTSGGFGGFGGGKGDDDSSSGSGSGSGSSEEESGDNSSSGGFGGFGGFGDKSGGSNSTSGSPATESPSNGDGQDSSSDGSSSGSGSGFSIEQLLEWLKTLGFSF